MCQLQRGMEALRQNSKQRKRKDLFICNSWERAMKAVWERQAVTTNCLNHFKLISVLGTSETTRDQQQGLCWKHRSHPWGRAGSLHQVSGAEASTAGSSLPLAWGHGSLTPWRAWGALQHWADALLSISFLLIVQFCHLDLTCLPEAPAFNFLTTKLEIFISFGETKSYQYTTATPRITNCKYLYNITGFFSTNFYLTINLHKAWTY